MSDSTTDPATDDDLVPGLADPAPLAPETAAAPRPHIRFAAVVWGVILAALGSAAVWFVWTPASADAAAAWLIRATPGSWVVVALVGVLVIGAIILIGSLLGAVHRAQNRVL